MTQSKKANQWYFGMKAHIGVDAKSGLVHTAGVTTGKVHDAKVMANLVREDDTAVYGYKGYASDAKKRAAEAAVPGTLTLRESAARLRPLFHAPQHAGADLARLIWINGERLHPAFSCPGRHLTVDDRQRLLHVPASIRPACEVRSQTLPAFLANDTEVA